MIAFLILTATGMHLIYRRQRNLEMDTVSATATTEPVFSRTTTINSLSNTNPTDEVEQSTSSDEIRPLISRSEGSVDSGM